MTVSNFLDILQIDESQSQKATAANIAMEQLAKTLSARYAISTSGVTLSGQDIVLPYDDGGDLTNRQGLHNIFYDILPGAPVTFDIVHPPVAHLFVARNQTTVTARFVCQGLMANLSAGQWGMFYCNGQDIIRVDLKPATITMPNDLQVSFFERPIANQVIGRFFIGRETIIPSNMSGSNGRVGINPTSAVVLTLRDNGASIGTVNISTTGVVTFSTSGFVRPLSVGDVVDLVMQGVADPTLENIEINRRATVNVAQETRAIDCNL